MRVLALLALCGCHAFYQVHGTVTRCDDHQPIAGAKVTLTYPGERGVAETAADGSFSIAANDPPGNEEAVLEISAPGMQTLTEHVHHGDDRAVCLQVMSGPTLSIRQSLTSPKSIE